MMSAERFTYDKPLVAFSKGGINDNATGETYEFTMDTVLDLLNEQQATIEEYKDFCLNLCKFLIQKRLVDEYREKYGKEYKIITKWW